MQQPRRIAIALQIDEPYPHHQEALAGVQQYARERECWQCLIDEHPMHAPNRRGKGYGGYDGVIARADPAMVRRLKRLGIPFVNVLYQSARPNVPGVYPNAELLGQAAGDHLLERGFRSLCYMGEVEKHLHSARVSKAFTKHVAEEGGTGKPYRIPNVIFAQAADWMQVEKRVDQWVRDLTPPVGLFVEEAAVARLVIQRAQQAGWFVPQDLAVLVQHNLKAVVEVAPQISSIQINNERIGYEAARLLDRLIDGETYTGSPVLIPPKGIVGRESTDYFAVQDPLVAEALQFIGARLATPLRVEDIAYELNVSTRLLQARFSAALGRGVSEEVRRLRLSLAKRLLSDPDRPIADVAERSGFGRPQLFSAVFRREEGMTPSAYRKQVLEGERPFN